MNQCTVSFEEIISLENLCEAWQEFIVGKRKKKDVQEFALHLGDELVHLHTDLVSGKYHHGEYHEFHINDPKPRVIHKASVRDRILHHAIHRQIYPFFAETFIADSYSCQIGKGSHRALMRFTELSKIVSRKHSRTCWVLKCDIRKFFASINHEVLILNLCEQIADDRITGLLYKIIQSFHVQPGAGLPLGNLTSQLLSNIFMHRFDEFVRQQLGCRNYIRYADDFVLLSNEKQLLEVWLPVLADFLHTSLMLDLHPRKIELRTVASGIDVLGWVHFPHHAVLRTKAKHRMLKANRLKRDMQSLQSFLGASKYGNAYRIQKRLLNDFWLSGG